MAAARAKDLIGLFSERFSKADIEGFFRPLRR